MFRWLVLTTLLVWTSPLECSTDVKTLPLGEGVVYLRSHPRRGTHYVGQAKSMTRFLERQREHDRVLGTRHDYVILGRAQPGLALDFLEETHIRARGGPPTLENRIHEMDSHRWAEYLAQWPEK